MVVCSRSDHESFSGVPFHGNCVVPWIVSVFCQRWLLLRLIGQLDVRPEVAPPEKGRASCANISKTSSNSMLIKRREKEGKYL